MLNYIGKYFTLNRRERNGIMVLLTLILILVTVKYLVVYRYQNKTENTILVELDDAAAKLAAQEMLSTNENYSGNTSFSEKIKKDSLFYFDPNTVTMEQALQLGFFKKCAAQLINYRNKGGKFYKPEDLQKLYCMEKSLYNKLKTFILIGMHSTPDTKRPIVGAIHNDGLPKNIEINSADSVAWMSLKGIGPGYSRRILKYRSILGGFTSVEQIKEVYNFPDSVYQVIKPHLTVNASLVQKLKVNSVDFKTLVHHPYIKYEGTKCIFALKRGKSIKEEDLVNSSCFSREQLQKVLPYLDFE